MKVIALIGLNVFQGNFNCCHIVLSFYSLAKPLFLTYYFGTQIPSLVIPKRSMRRRLENRSD